MKGVVQYDVQLVLKKLVKTKLIPSSSDSNNNLKTINFENMCVSKINSPNLKQDSECLPGSATQNM